MTLTDAFVVLCAGHYLFVHPSSTSTLHANHPNLVYVSRFLIPFNNSDILHNMSVLSRGVACREKSRFLLPTMSEDNILEERLAQLE